MVQGNIAIISSNNEEKLEYYKLAHASREKIPRMQRNSTDQKELEKCELRLNNLSSELGRKDASLSIGNKISEIEHKIEKITKRNICLKDEVNKLRSHFESGLTTFAPLPKKEKAKEMEVNAVPSAGSGM